MSVFVGISLQPRHIPKITEPPIGGLCSVDECSGTDAAKGLGRHLQIAGAIPVVARSCHQPMQDVW